MSQIRLVIADKDYLFLEKFGAYIQKNGTFRFALEFFTEPSKLDQWLAYGERADLLAISSSFYNEMTRKPEGQNVILLCDCHESLLPQGYISVHKYKPAELLLKEMLSVCADNISRRLNRNDDSGRIHLVLYGDGSDVLNPFAQALAYFLAQNRKSTFYLNLDELSNTDAFFTGSNSKGLSEMLYYVKSQKENLSLKAEACSSKDPKSGVEFMKGHLNADDIGQMTASELECLIQSIRSRGCYDDIVISRAFRYDSLLHVIIKEAYKIYITGLAFQTSLDRLSKIGGLISRIEENEGLELKHKVLFCVAQYYKGQQLVFEVPDYNRIYLPFPFEDGTAIFPPSGVYMSALKSIIDY